MPETVKMAPSRCYQTITNVTSQGEKLEIVFPLDNGHFITGKARSFQLKKSIIPLPYKITTLTSYAAALDLICLL